MSIEDITGASSKERGVKTLAIRLEPDLHAQLSLIAQLRRSTITDEIRAALTTHIASIKAQPALAARADDVLESTSARHWRDAKPSPPCSAPHRSRRRRRQGAVLARVRPVMGRRTKAATSTDAQQAPP